MVKTLRITSFVVAALAVLLVLLPAVFGVRGDEDMEKFLNSPGAAEQFSKARGNRARTDRDQSSPLVKQAEKFALYLNPPTPKPDRPTRPRPTPSGPRKEVQVSSKFKVIGTCFYDLHPELSMALIDQPGKGLLWVRQGSKVGHSIVEQVKDGVVVIKDGKGTYELSPKREKKPGLVKSLSAEKQSSPEVLPGPNEPARAPGRTKVKVRTAAAPTSEDEAQLMQQFIAELKAMQAKTQETGQGDAELDAFLAEIESERVSAKEAEKLDDMGKELQERGRDPNEPNEPKTSLPKKVEGPTKRRNLRRKR